MTDEKKQTGVASAESAGTSASAGAKTSGAVGAGAGEKADATGAGAKDAKATGAKGSGTNAGAGATNTNASATPSKPTGTEHAPKEKSRRLPVIIGTIVVVVIVAGIGFGVWHDQPSFCNAICHTPMDGYLKTYESTPGQASTDKWGNEVSNASSMMAPLHAKQNITCVGCHVPTLGEQVSEGLSWVSGNYEVIQTNDKKFVPAEKTLSQLTKARGIAGEQFCLNSGCHTNSDGSTMTRDDLVEKTSYMSRNVHTQPHGEVACSDCHKAHRASTVTCSQCHTDVTLPEGWISATEAQSLEPVAVSTN